MDGLKRFAKVAGGEKAVVPVVAVEQKNVSVAVELAVLEAVVEQVDLRPLLVFGRPRLNLGELAGLEALPRNVDWEAGFARDQERLVAEFVCGAVGADTNGKRARAPVASGEGIDLESALGEGVGEGDGERCLAGAAGGEVADADDWVAEAADRLETGAAAKLTRGEGEPVEGNERKKELAGRGRIAHASSFTAVSAGSSLCSA
jgi:hypothetical protein